VSKWAVWVSNLGVMHVVPTTPSGEQMQEPHIADLGCECRPYVIEGGTVVHNGEDEKPSVQ
jgi:hypothetical protein